MGKLSLAISCPIDTYSGYGARARDLVKAILATEKYNVQILSQRWGNTRFGYLEDHGEDEIASLIVPHLTAKPDVWVQHTVPNEFQKVGTYNIGVTAGIETTLAPPSWIEGVNRMDLVLVSAQHAKTVFEQTKVDMVDNKTGQKKGTLQLETKVEVLFEGVDTTKYFSYDYYEREKSEPNFKEFNLTEIINLPDPDKLEKYFFLTVGTWLQGNFGQDRKNIGYTIKSFLETFKNKKNAPGLLIKTSHATSSLMDREAILKKIDGIRKTVKGRLPNIYLIHGDLTDEQMNQLYNHPRVKAMVSLTKGEGYGRPLLEFTQSGKLVIASGWSGHLDFLDKDNSILIGGTLENVDPSAANDMILKEAQWFKPDDIQVGTALKNTFEHYNHLLRNVSTSEKARKAGFGKYFSGARRLGERNAQKFSLEAMTNKLDEILEANLPEFPEQIELVLPKLELPKLEKLDG